MVLEMKLKKEFIKIIMILIIFFFDGLYFLVSAEQQSLISSTNDIAGIWEGKLQVPGMELRIVFHITVNPEGELIATMDSPDQGVRGIPVDEVILQDNILQLTIKSIGGSYQGDFNSDLIAIEGIWQQSGTSFKLSLLRVDKAIEIKRLQEPKKPYPYIEEEVRFENKAVGIVLTGTLTFPAESGPFPAVILISGSGPQDRNETVFGHRPFLILADYLTRHGIAVLRFDDRGVGESGGDYALATSEDFATDVLAGISYLKSRIEIKPWQIGLIGHSEGGLIAPMVAVQFPDIAFIVLMAGPGLSGEEILYLQNKLISRARGLSEEEIIRDKNYNREIYSLIKIEENEKVLAEKLRKILLDYVDELSGEEKNRIGNIEMYLSAQIQSLLTPWFKYFLIYDPRSTLSMVSCPVLALIGEKDLQVPPEENLKAIGSSLLKGGNRDFTIKEFPGLNHLFQTALTGSPDEYAEIEETISPVVLEYIKDWIWLHIN